MERILEFPGSPATAPEPLEVRVSAIETDLDRLRSILESFGTTLEQQALFLEEVGRIVDARFAALEARLASLKEVRP